MMRNSMFISDYLLEHPPDQENAKEVTTDIGRKGQLQLIR